MNFIRFYLKKYADFIIPFSLFTATFLIYLHNLSRFVYGGDVGDILLAVGVRGVAHPSGYPLITLLGIIFSYLPISQPLAYKVALISALSSSLSVVFVYLICLYLTKNKIISMISSLILAFSYLFWLYAEMAEVFSLSVLFFLLLFYLALKYYEKKSNTYLYLLAFSTGLSLSHHLMILAIFPSLLILIIRSNWKIIFDYKILLKCIALFLLGLLPYLYIPIAASQYPVYSWDNVVNVKNFIQLITRADYAWTPDLSNEHVNSSLNMRLLGVLTYFVDIYHVTSIFVLVIALLGAIYLIIRKQYSYLISLFLAFFLTGPFFIFYQASANVFIYTGGVIERFYAFSLIYIIILSSLGVSSMIDRIEKLLKSRRIKINRIKIYKLILYLCFLILPFYLLIVNFKTTDLSNVSLGEEFGKDYLRNLPEKSFIFITGDTAFLNALYVQYVLGFRKDITMISPQQPNLNMKFVKQIYPEFVDNMEQYPKLKSKINKLVLDSYGTRPVFTGYGATSIEEKGIEWMPFGLSQRMIIGGTYNPSEEDFIKQTNSIWSKMNYKKFSELSEAEKKSQILLTVQKMYSYSAVKTGTYLMKKYSNLEEAKKYFGLADQIYPIDNLGKWGLANYYFAKKECKKSEEIIKGISQEDKKEKTPYVYLYLIYDKCFNDKVKSAQLEKNYNKLFNEEISKERKDFN